MSYIKFPRANFERIFIYEMSVIILIFVYFVQEILRWFYLKIYLHCVSFYGIGISDGFSNKTEIKKYQSVDGLASQGVSASTCTYIVYMEASQ